MVNRLHNHVYLCSVSALHCNMSCTLFVLLALPTPLPCIVPVPWTSLLPLALLTPLPLPPSQISLRVARSSSPHRPYRCPAVAARLLRYLLRSRACRRRPCRAEPDRLHRCLQVAAACGVLPHHQESILARALPRVRRWTALRRSLLISWTWRRVSSPGSPMTHRCVCVLS